MNANEIAKLAGVSRSTVTRVVNNYPDISEDTRKKVLKVIEQYHYAPDISAQILAGKKPKEIGLFLGIDNEHKISSSSYYGKLITYAIDRAEELGYSVLTSIIRNEDFSNVLRFLNTKTIQGAIVMGGFGNLESVKGIKKNHKVIFVEQFDEKSKILENFGLTNIDNYKGAILATEFLIKKGHKRIMHITRSGSFYYSDERLRGYKDALIRNDIKVDKNLIIKVGSSDDFSEKIIKEYIKTNLIPTAIFAVTDLMAIEIIKALKKCGFNVPKDISVIGFDDIEIGDLIEPRLTTVNVNTEKMIYDTVDEIINSIENNTIPKGIKIREVNIVERDSVLENRN